MVSDFKRKQKPDAKLDLLLKAGLAVIILATLGLAVANIRMYQKRKALSLQVEKLKNEIQQIEQKNKDLERGIAMSDDEVYVETVAREELDLQKPGEKVYSFIQPEPKEETENKERKNIFQIWAAWIGGFFKN